MSKKNKRLGVEQYLVLSKIPYLIVSGINHGYYNRL